MKGKEDYAVMCTKTDKNGNRMHCVFVSCVHREDKDGGDAHDKGWYYMNWNIAKDVNVSGDVPQV